MRCSYNTRVMCFQMSLLTRYVWKSMCHLELISLSENVFRNILEKSQHKCHGNAVNWEILSTNEKKKTIMILLFYVDKINFHFKFNSPHFQSTQYFPSNWRHSNMFEWMSALMHKCINIFLVKKYEKKSYPSENNNTNVNRMRYAFMLLQ